MNNFIQFESAREKEKARHDLREAREQLLEQAKKRAEQRAEREAQKELRGEKNWMLPSLEAKLTKNENRIRKPKKKKSKKKHSKKSKKKSSKKSSSDSSDSSHSDDSSTEDSLTEDEPQKQKKKKSKNKKKSKKTHKKKSNRKRKMSTSSDSSDSDSDSNEQEKDESQADEWVEAKTSQAPVQRESWMTDSLMLKTYSRERTVKKPNENQQIDSYDPAKSTRELNPYWKTTGTGLPAFQKPRDEDDDDGGNNRNNYKQTMSLSSSKSWKKSSERSKSTNEKFGDVKANKSPSSASDSDEDESKHYKRNETSTKAQVNTTEFLTDQQMNELGAKLLKAEIMGNMELAEELKEKLEKARAQRSLLKEQTKTKQLNSKKTDKISNTKEEHIILTHTDAMGQTRPLPQTQVDPRDLYGGRKGRKNKTKSVSTHSEGGERLRYFADDDRYNLKQMFEREKYTTAADANLQFANIAAKHKNPNDDLEDIFAEKVSKDISSQSERKEMDNAIREHQKMEAALDNCEKCFDSVKLQKEHLVSVGEKIYLSIPWYIGLQPGHCIITPTQHISCSTQLDEDAWFELNDFRKALTRMFAAQRKDVIFFEIANRLHKRPHMAIHCIPIDESKGEMAPFYFKKAIEESEHEWSVNKQLVSLKQKSLRSSIPKGLPYFWVNFGMDSGFAHVIEDEQRFPPNFAQEIIGGMLHLNANAWRKLKKEQNTITKVKQFADWWKKYDCTK